MVRRVRQLWEHVLLERKDLEKREMACRAHPA